MRSWAPADGGRVAALNGRPGRPRNHRYLALAVPGLDFQYLQYPGNFKSTSCIEVCQRSPKLGASRDHGIDQTCRADIETELCTSQNLIWYVEVRQGSSQQGEFFRVFQPNLLRIGKRH